MVDCGRITDYLEDMDQSTINKKRQITIKGAGIAGLTSAILLAEKGYEVQVLEKSGDVGVHRYEDFQGLENWTDEEDVIKYLRRLGIGIDFWCKPVSKVTFFSHDNRRFDCLTKRPLLYMVKRGASPGCLDYSLKKQALNSGVEIFFNQRTGKRHHIDSSGAKKAQAFAHGITFATDSPDIVSAIIDDRVAPKGYSYFIALEGRATLVTAFFTKPFQGSKRYFQETLRRYRELLTFEIKNPKEFGSYISFSFLKPGNGAVIGEAAGIQDYLFGFGMRLAIKSAELAVRSISENDDYYRFYKREILPFLRAGLVNRFLYERLGNIGYKRRLEVLSPTTDIGKIMNRSYHFSFLHRLIYPLARIKYHRVLSEGGE